MAFSIGAQKITLQIISVIFLIIGIISIVMGASLLTRVDGVSKQIEPSADTDTSLAVAKFLSWYLIIIGVFMSIFAIFGIYSVAKESAGKIKTYGIIHVVLLVLTIIGIFLHPSASSIISILLSGGAVYLSFSLAKHFSAGRSMNSV